MATKEVIILGTGASRVECPFDCETWGVNGVYAYMKHFIKDNPKARLDKLFITDYLFSPQGALHFDINHLNAVAEKYHTKVFTMHRLHLGKYKVKATRFPYKRITKKFKSDYLTSSICYMLAYALDKGYAHLKLYGVDMTTKKEYLLQKAAIEYWIGRIEQKTGNTVFVCPGSTIMARPSAFPYGIRPKYNLKEIDPYNLLGGNK